MVQKLVHMRPFVEAAMAKPKYDRWEPEHERVLEEYMATFPHRSPKYYTDWTVMTTDLKHLETHLGGVNAVSNKASMMRGERR